MKRYRDILYCSDMSVVTGQANDFKVKAGSFRFDIRKKLFTMSMMACSNRLSREVVHPLSLAIFKVSLDDFEKTGLGKDVPS